jgi:hypothetical protein
MPSLKNRKKFTTDSEFSDQEEKKIQANDKSEFKKKRKKSPV